MNKKQKNRKQVKQNNRNRIKNRRSVSIIKTLSKLLKNKIKSKKSIDQNLSDQKIENTDEKKKIKILISKFFSVLDKAAQKGVIHKNRAAAKKSKMCIAFKNEVNFFDKI
jgi:ribosomal protein S20